MRIAVIGGGYVGLVSGVCLAECGHEVTIVEISPEKVSALRHGKVPIYEPGLEEIIARNKAHLTYTTEMSEGVPTAEVVFIAVGTPPLPNGEADLSFIFTAVEEIAAHAPDRLVVVTKSTVPIGTNRQIAYMFHVLRPDAKIKVVSNPEFLREGNAISDFMTPDRIVVGADSDYAFDVMRRVYATSINQHVAFIAVSIEAAETIKYAANAFLATKVAFINEMADLCEKTGADIHDVSLAMGMDHRIGRSFLKAGPGYGGSCFPKDTLALIATARAFGSSVSVVEAVVASNDLRKRRMAQRIMDVCEGASGKTICVLGLAFKANTDDVRDSPSLEIVPALVAAGAVVHAHDPEAMGNAKTLLPSSVRYFDTVIHAAKGVDAVVVLTEWQDYAEVEPEVLKTVMRGNIVFDLRGVMDAVTMRAAGFQFHSVGLR